MKKILVLTLALAILGIALTPVAVQAQKTVTTNVVPMSPALSVHTILMKKDTVQTSGTDSTWFIAMPYTFNVICLQAISNHIDTGSATPGVIVGFGLKAGYPIVADTMNASQTIYTSIPSSSTKGHCAAGTYKFFFKSGSGKSTNISTILHYTQ